MNPMETWQRSKIYAIGNALGIVDKSGEDELHMIIFRITGLDSMKLLDSQQANDIISELQRIQSVSSSPMPKKKRTATATPAIAGRITKGQIDKIWALMFALRELDLEPNSAKLGDRLCAIIKKELKTDCIKKTPFVWIDFKQGNKLIEVLKKYIASAKRKAGVG